MKSDPRLDAVLRSGVQLPAPSHSLLRLQAAVNDDRAGPRETAAIAAQDPVLVGALMRIGNSPVFYHGGSAGTLGDVIARLGGTRTLAIAVGTALCGQIEGIAPRIVDSIWSRSVELAGVALEAALRQRRRNLADGAYLAALVHEAGICVLLRRFPQHAKLFDRQGALVRDEAAIALDVATGTDHAAVGCLVARNWKLPPAVCEAVRVHHSPEATLACDRESASLAALVAVSRRVVDGPSVEWECWAPIAAALVGVDDAALENLVDHVRGVKV